jgi:hypothetical protein
MTRARMQAVYVRFPRSNIPVMCIFSRFFCIQSNAFIRPSL